MLRDVTTSYANFNGLLTVGRHGERSSDRPVHERHTMGGVSSRTDIEATMKIPQTLPRMHRLAAVGTVAAAIFGLGTLVGLALPQYTVSQKGREFNPHQITIKRGETIEIVNDDGDLLHHAYIDSKEFSFDSGD